MEITQRKWTLSSGFRDHLLDIDMDERGLIAHVCTDHASDATDEEESIARLICASPKLYKAAVCAMLDIDGLLEQLDYDPNDLTIPVCQTLAELKEAIAEAEGKEA